MSERVSVGVVIPTHGRARETAMRVSEYLAQGADEVIVILDGAQANKETSELYSLQDPRFRVLLLEENRGAALARLAGIEATSTDIVLLVDDDVAPGPDLVEGHRKAHQGTDPHVVVGYMPVRLPAQRDEDEAATYLYALEYEAHVKHLVENPDQVLQGLWMGNVSGPRELLLSAETVLPTVRMDYSEDLDFGLRLAALGARGVYNGDLRAEHLHRRDLDAFAREAVRRGESVAILEQRWPQLPAHLQDLVTVESRPLPLRVVFRVLLSRRGSAAGQALLRSSYKMAGRAKRWDVQDNIARLLRQNLAIEGYRDAQPSAKNHALSNH